MPLQRRADDVDAVTATRRELAQLQGVALAADANNAVVPVSDVPASWMLLDIGPETRERYAQVVRAAKLVIWNGPMGVFEAKRFEGLRDPERKWWQFW